MTTILNSLHGIGAVSDEPDISHIAILYSFIGFLSTIYYAHSVGSSIMGAYFLFMTYFGIIALVTDGGLGGGAAIKRISEEKNLKLTFSAFFVMRTFIVAIALICLIIFKDLFIDLETAVDLLAFNSP